MKESRKENTGKKHTNGNDLFLDCSLRKFKKVFKYKK